MEIIDSRFVCTKCGHPCTLIVTYEFDEYCNTPKVCPLFPEELGEWEEARFIHETQQVLQV